MNYPLISEYIEVINSAEDNFNELTNLRAVLDDDGQPVMTSGNFAVVFKMRNEKTGKLYALKCFTKEQEGRAEAYHQIAEELKNVDSPYLVSVRFLEKELFVDTEQTDETEFPVLLMDWVEGKMLDKYLRENLDDKYALEMLAYRFSQLAQWLIPQPFAHGDLKPDNILVRENGTLVLVDYDGMYVPAMKGQKARELGSPDFRHPLRNEDDFDEHIDDFSFVSILLSLKAISLHPLLFRNSDATDNLLLSRNDYCKIGKCGLLREIFPSDDMEMNCLISLFVIVLHETFLTPTQYWMLEIKCPVSHQVEIVSTSVSEMEWNSRWMDDYGAYYSKDSKMLISGPIDRFLYYTNGVLETLDYPIRETTKIVADRAFEDCVTIGNITIPESVTHIGERAFHCLEYLSEIILPSSVVYLGNNPFRGCDNLKRIVCLSDCFVVKDNILYSKGRDRLICCYNKDVEMLIPEMVTRIDSYAFSGCFAKNVMIPDSVASIGDFAFEHSINLESVTISKYLTSIGEGLFCGCEKLVKVIMTSPHTTINSITFAGCDSIKELVVPYGSKNFYEMQLPGYESVIVEMS